MLKAIAAILIVLAVAFWFFRTRAPSVPLPEGIAGLPDGTTVAVEIADTPASRSRGLSGRDDLPKGQGMLFIYDTPGVYGFWMQGMRFPIDMVWMDEGKFVTVASDVPYQGASQFAITNPTAPADMILELPAGYASAHGVVEGATLDIRLPSR